MKKFILCAFMALTGAVLFQGCSTWLPPNKEEVEIMVKDYADSVIFESLNPVFSTAEDVVIFRETLADKMKEDSIFFSLSEKTLCDVATVCIKKTGYASKRHIVEEYKAHNDVYKNLPATTDPPTNTNTEGSGVTKVGPETVIIGTDYNYRTDTIDGVPRKVLYKTEKSYEK